MLFLTLLGGANAAWAQEVTYDFTGSDWTASDGVLTDGTVTITGEGSANFKMNGGYFMLGKQGAYITLPAYSFDVEKIEVVGRTGASGSCKQNIFVDDVAVSTETTGVTGTNTYEIDQDYQAAGTQYTIKVTSSHNTQITAIKIYKAGTAALTVATPTFSPEGGAFTTAQEVEISTTTEGATIYYTLDGSTPSSSSDEYEGAIEIDETTTIKAIAVKEGMTDSDVAEATYTIITGGDSDSWIETNLADLTEDDVFVIVGNNGANYAMSNDKGTGYPPAAVSVTVSNGLLTGTIPDNIKWNISGNASNGYTFYPDGNTSTWLYCTGTNNGVRVGDNTANTFTVDQGYLKHAGTSRYVGIYNSQDWRCYTSINSNIQGQTFKFYKKPTDGPVLANPELAFSETSVSAQVGGDFTAPTLTYADGFDGTIVYESSDPTVATVDESTGEVTIIGAGTTTITASSEATENFRAGSASYTLTVNAPITAITIAEARTKSVDTEVLVHGVVTSVYTKTAYIEDGTAAIVVYGDNNLSVAAGDVISVRGILADYHGLLEIKTPTIESYDGSYTVNVNNYTIDQITNNDQAEVVRIENATVTEINNLNVTIAQGDNTILVRFNRANDITFAVDDVISLTGNIGCYDGPQIANPREVEVLGEISYYLAGTMTDWADNKVEMTKNADGSYTLTGVEMAEAAEFKIIKMEAGSSDPVWLGGQADGNQYWLTADNHTDVPLVAGANFYMPIAGTWDITVSFDANNNPLITVDGSWPEKTYYLAGDFNDWNTTATPLTKNADGTYTVSQVIELDEEFKIVDSDGAWYGAEADGDFWVTTDISDNPISMSVSNGHNLVMKVENDKAWTLTFDATDKTLTITGWPIVLDGNAYVKVTSTDDLTDGHYLIVYEGNDTHSSVAFDGSYEDANGKLDAANNIIDVTIAEKLIVANDATNAAAFIIESTGNENEYTIKSSNDKYIGKTANSNGLDTSTSTAYTNTIDFDDDGNAVITASGNCILRYNYASDQQRFRYYRSGQQPIALYKLTTVDEIPVTIGSTGYSTLYYSDKALAIPEGMTAQYVSQVGDNDGKITFTEINNHFIPKNTAVVLKATQGSYTFFEIPGSEEFAPADNLLLGTDAAELTTAKGWAENLDCKFYMLSRNSKGEDKSVGFYFAKNCPNGEAFTNGAHKAYLAVPKSLNAKSCYLFSEAEIADGIGAVESPMFNTEDLKIYNLNGQRVNTLQRGIYIINGKKVLVK